MEKIEDYVGKFGRFCALSVLLDFTSKMTCSRFDAGPNLGWPIYSDLPLRSDRKLGRAIGDRTCDIWQVFTLTQCGSPPTTLQFWRGCQSEGRTEDRRLQATVQAFDPMIPHDFIGVGTLGVVCGQKRSQFLFIAPGPLWRTAKPLEVTLGPTCSTENPACGADGPGRGRSPSRSQRTSKKVRGFLPTMTTRRRSPRDGLGPLSSQDAISGLPRTAVRKRLRPGPSGDCVGSLRPSQGCPDDVSGDRRQRAACPGLAPQIYLR
jgi:hypothetical protein